MSITDELREYAKGEAPYYEMAALLEIADRIDAEYEKAIHELNGLAEVSVLLPKDADGEYIRVGDEVIYIGLTKKERVTWIAFGDNGEQHVNTTGGSYTKPELLRHYKPPTVEDVLREMLYKAHIYDEREMELLPDLIAEYAAKLQLRGEDE